MRLSEAEQSAISVAARQVLPAGSRVALFGSRTDETRRGGDIDLLVEPPMHLTPQVSDDMCARFAARLYRLLGERRIDIVVARGVADDRLIITEARRQAIELVHT